MLIVFFDYEGVVHREKVCSKSSENQQRTFYVEVLKILREAVAQRNRPRFERVANGFSATITRNPPGVTVFDRTYY